MQPTCWREPKLPASYICISTSPRIITNSAPLVVIADLNSTLTRVCSTPKSDVTETTHLICIVQLKHLTFHSCILEHAEHKKTVMCCCSKIPPGHFHLFSALDYMVFSIVTAATTGQNFDQLFSAVWQLTTLIFRALTIDHVAFQPLTVDYTHIYGNIKKNA